MTDLSAKRQALDRLDARLADGEITADEYERSRNLLTSGLTLKQCAELGVTPTPAPRSFGDGGVGPSGGATRMPTLAELEIQPGAVLLDQWRIVRELGRGGFGAVFEAEDIKLGRTLAVKVLDPSMAAKEELLARFRREVTLMRELAHERIVRVYDYREEAAEHLALITMEYVRGCSVAEVLALARGSKKRVPVALALAVFEQTLEALAAAHAQGVIHRDVTPGNILLAGGTAAELMSDPERDPRVKLVDFGIAGLVERTELSAKSRVLGTAAYVAPEVLDPDAEITPEADVFGAGAVVYDLLTGKTPMVTGYEPVRELRRDIPAFFNDVVTAAVRPKAGDRPSAKIELDRIARGRASAGRAEPEPDQHTLAARPVAGGAESPPGKNKRLFLMVVAAAVAVALVFGGIWLTNSRDEIDLASSSPTPSADPTPRATATSTPLSEVAKGSPMATLVIRSNVAGDTAWLDGGGLGPTPHEVQVSPGRHLVRVTKEGCSAEERWVELDAGDRQSALFELECATPTPARVPPAPTVARVPTNTPTVIPTPAPATQKPVRGNAPAPTKAGPNLLLFESLRFSPASVVAGSETALVLVYASLHEGRAEAVYHNQLFYGEQLVLDFGEERKVLADGGTYEITWPINIPGNAPSGMYSLRAEVRVKNETCSGMANLYVGVR